MASKDLEELENLIISRIKTTMIGAIADIEDLDIDDETFNEIRSKILDRGNSQIRSIQRELDNYRVTRVYKYNFRIKE